MLTFPLVALIALFGALGAYGIQKRRKWAWYAGIAFQFILAGAVSLLSYGVILQIATLTQAVYATLSILGAIAIWSSWVAWWGCHHREFGIGRNPPPAQRRAP